ncbi:hypothetical protein FOMPIDRAFT_1021609 [Fomitopsis schrenkii]|uniref:Enoyl reductase (ER) domain-containing protein n=1 Tax=Fomitopsis schrenkii TaxID=2126942 RepID=S8EMH6_FOMSC|nr:hypothetical protein FOMPIDRAFT_1021609 [Fomitopsis schrenkii]
MSQLQKALYLVAKHGSFSLKSASIPHPGPGEILLKQAAIGLNPVDEGIQSLGYFIKEYPAILGLDLAGIVEEVGEGVTNVKKGDRVLSQGTLGINEHGAYQQYALGYAASTSKIPDSLSFDQAASIPLTLSTASIALYHPQGAMNGTAALTPPWEVGGRGKYRGHPTVVFGGATSVGQYAIQLLKLSGFSPIITTASPRNAAWLRELGATHVLDRNLADDALRAAVKQITSGPIKVIYDTVSLPATQDAAYDLLTPGGTLALVLPPAIQADKQAADKIVFQVYGDCNVPQHRAFGTGLFASLYDLLKAGEIKPNLVEVLPNGLLGIPDGLQRFKQGVSNVKLIVRPQETPEA